MKFRITLILIGIAALFSRAEEALAETDPSISKEKKWKMEVEKIFGNIIPELQSLHFFEGSLEEREKRLSQLKAVQYTSLVFLAELDTRQFIQSLFDPLRSIITANPCKANVPCTFLQNYETWVSFSGGKGFIHNNRQKRGFRLSDYEIAGGVQATFYRQWTFGAGLSYEHDHISYKVGGFGHKNTLLGGLYGLYRGKRFYGIVDLIMGHSNDHIRRKIDMNDTSFKPHGSVKVHQRSFYGELGTDFAIDNTLIQPFLGLEWGHFSYSQFSESGGAPFAVAISRNTLSTAYSYLGLHLTSPPLRCGFSMNIDLAWRYQLKKLSNNISVDFEQFNNPFKVRAMTLNRNSYEGTVRFSQTLYKSWEIYFDVTGLGWDNSTIYKFLGGIKTTW